MWWFMSAAAAAPFVDADQVTFTDDVNLRAAPSTQAEVVATLPLGTDVDVVSQGEPLTLWGRTEPWVRVTAEGHEGWLWSGLLTDRFTALGTDGDGVVVGIRGLVRESEYSVRVSVEVGARVGGKVLTPARADLTVPSEWTAKGVPFAIELVKSGMTDADPVLRLHYSADYCGGMMGNMLWARHGDQMVHLATLPEGSDAPMFANNGLLFPGESGGQPGHILHVVQVGEYNDDGSETYETHTSTPHTLSAGRLSPPLPEQ